MGLTTKKIVGLNVQTLIKLLNQALADEWLAFYQYWVGARQVEGILRERVQKELQEHADDEYKHAIKLADRIMELDGTLILDPKDWFKLANCKFEAPVDSAIIPIVNQNLRGERCAIVTYNKILKLTDRKDPVTFHLALDIIKDEIDHENDLEMILEDLKKM
ncbi:MAG: ferritin [Chlamydiae bacterium]|nr:ferritin [Chlamydiota bacterium]